MYSTSIVGKEAVDLVLTLLEMLLALDMQSGPAFATLVKAETW